MKLTNEKNNSFKQSGISFTELIIYSFNIITIIWLLNVVSSV